MSSLVAAHQSTNSPPHGTSASHADPPQSKSKCVRNSSVRSRNLATAKKNVYTCLLYTFILNTALCITLGPIFNKYVYQLGGGNVFVGLVDSVTGCVTLAVIAPVAWLIDRRGPGRRAGLIWQSALVGTAAVSLFAYAITCDDLPFLYLSLASNGFYYELLNSSMGALFTDSAQALGGRSNASESLQLWTVRQSVVGGVASCFGPIVTLWVMCVGADPAAVARRYFRSRVEGAAPPAASSHLHSDANDLQGEDAPAAGVWSLGFMHLILVSGLLLYAPLLLSTFCFQDLEDEDRVPAEGSRADLAEPLLAAGDRRGAPPVANTSGVPNDRAVDEVAVAVADHEAATSAPIPSGFRSTLGRLLSAGSRTRSESKGSSAGSSPASRRRSGDDFELHDPEDALGGSGRSDYDGWRKYVPYIITASDVVTCLGVGMSSQFIMLFLIEDFQFTGVEVTQFQLASSLGIIVFIVALQSLNERGLGSRCQISWTCTLISIGSYFALGSGADQGDWRWICVFAVLANLAFAKGPLDKSLVLENTAATERGKWNAVQSFGRGFPSDKSLCGSKISG